MWVQRTKKPQSISSTKVSMVQLFQTVLLEKVEVLKSAIFFFFKKVVCLVKTIKKTLFDKVECLANTYKSGGLSCKLPKKTRYI